MKIFKMDLDGGKPAEGKAGVQPEWFYKGGGDIVIAPDQALPVPHFAEDAGEEPDLVDVNLIGPSGQLFSMGFAIGNGFSDHVIEKFNYHVGDLHLHFMSTGTLSFVDNISTKPGIVSK